MNEVTINFSLTSIADCLSLAVTLCSIVFALILLMHPASPLLAVLWLIRTVLKAVLLSLRIWIALRAGKTVWAQWRKTVRFLIRCLLHIDGS